MDRKCGFFTIGQFLACAVFPYSDCIYILHFLRSFKSYVWSLTTVDTISHTKCCPKSTERKKFVSARLRKLSDLLIISDFNHWCASYIATRNGFLFCNAFIATTVELAWAGNILRVTMVDTGSVKEESWKLKADWGFRFFFLWMS